MDLKSFILDVNKISDNDKKAMYQLMTLYYDNIVEEKFYNDLLAKSWAVISICFSLASNSIRSLS